ncbi:MAG: sialidase family protein [Actinomycetota bacterium]|nr:glycoside hydrolase [Actinomycetota bacterium]
MRLSYRPLRISSARRLAAFIVMFLSLTSMSARAVKDIDIGAGHDCGSTRENTPQIAVDASDPNHVVMQYLLGEGDEGAIASSRDGGATFTSELFTGITACQQGEPGQLVDPFIAIGSGGRTLVTEGWVTWYADLRTDHDALRQYALSTAGDAHVGDIADLDRAMGAQRAPVVFLPGSNDSVVAAYERFRTQMVGTYGSPWPVGESVAVVRSSDGGRTFSAPNVAFAPGPDRAAPTIGLVTSGGVIVLVVAETDPVSFGIGFAGAVTRAAIPSGAARYYALRSTDGGATFSAPISVGSGYCCIGDVAAGPNGEVYVVWTDTTGAGVAMASSHDAGLTWTTSIIPTDGPAVEPAVAVSRTGEVGLFYYRTAHEGIPTLPKSVAGAGVPDAGGHDLLTPMLARSATGGAAWAHVQLAAPFAVDEIADGSADGTPIGPYQDIAGIPSGFVVAATVGSGTEEHVQVFVR